MKRLISNDELTQKRLKYFETVLRMELDAKATTVSTEELSNMVQECERIYLCGRSK